MALHATPQRVALGQAGRSMSLNVPRTLASMYSSQAPHVPTTLTPVKESTVQPMNLPAPATPGPYGAHTPTARPPAWEM